MRRRESSTKAMPQQMSQRSSGGNTKPWGLAVAQIIGIEAGGVEGLAAPRQPDRNEEHDKPENTEGRKVVAELQRQLGHHCRKEQIIEELHPGGVPFFFAYFADAQLRGAKHELRHKRFPGTKAGEVG